MGFTNDNIKRICNFYVSDWHFAVMLLPYINNEINKGVKITTIFESSMEENIKILLEKLNLKNKDKILQIDWKNKENNNIDNYIEENIEEGAEEVFIINGDREYIENVNNRLNDYIDKKQIKGSRIKIVDCYEVSEDEEKMYNIIKMHDSILNTSGEQEIEQII